LQPAQQVSDCLGVSFQLFLVFAALLASPGTAYACPMCKDAVESNQQLATVYNWSIGMLVSLPFVLVALIMLWAVRALNPIAYQELKQRVWKFLWPGGWLYIASGISLTAWLFYVTTPVDAAARLRLPSARLAALPVVMGEAPVSPLDDRVVVVSFFASWCRPCVEQMADLAQLHTEFEGRSVAILSVNAFEDHTTPPGVPHLHPDGTLEFHEGAPDLPSFLAANHISLPVVVNTPELSASFGGVTRIPTTFVFDAQGRLVRRYVNEARGEFVKPTLEDLRRDIRAALACGRLSLPLIREACFLVTSWN
jgi:thiol-disulfide isomerase/thioredoxin